MLFSFAGIAVLALIFSFCLTRWITHSVSRDSSEIAPELPPPVFSLAPHCSECQKKLPYSFGIPILGSIRSKGFCPCCHQKQRGQSLILEVLGICGVFFLGYWHHWSLGFWIDLLFLYTLIAVAAIDGYTLTIESRLLVLTLMLRIVWLITMQPEFLLSGIQGMLIGAGALYWVGFVYETVRQRVGLGEGDAAVLGMIGLWVGWEGLGVLILLAALSGAVVGGILLLRQGNSLWNTQLPFAPFLCGAGFIVYCFQTFAQL